MEVTTTIRSWELDENSTRYDRLIAAPSDETLVAIWSIWSGIFFLITCFICIVFGGILASSKARKVAFNLYVVFLIIPDIIFTGSCVVTCVMNATAGHYYSKTMCYYQAWYVVFGVAGSAWMNGLIAWEVYKMLSTSHRGERYQPPTTQQVIGRSTCVLIGSALLAALGCFDLYQITKIPYKTQIQNGAVCAPMEYNTQSTIFFFLVAVPLMVAIPMGYVLWTSYRVLSQKMLPPEGSHRRSLAIYFFRIDVVFLAMWLPALFFFYVYVTSQPWVLFAASIWGHGQGFMSALLCTYKDDIRSAVVAFVRCRRREEDPGIVGVGVLPSTTSSARQLGISGKTNSKRGGGCSGSTIFITGLGDSGRLALNLADNVLAVGSKEEEGGGAPKLAEEEAEEGVAANEDGGGTEDKKCHNNDFST